MKKLLFLLTLISLSISPMQNVKSALKSATKEIGECVAIVGASIGAACLYGIANDQVTARICPEYFSEGFHKRMRDNWDGLVLGNARQILENTKSPTIVASIWGPIASWWVGARLAIPIALAARVGSWPKLGVKDLIKPLAVSCSITGMSALIAGAIGYYKAGDSSFNGLSFRSNFWDIMEGVPAEAERAFIADAFAHQAAYGVGGIVGVGLICYILAKRYSMSRQPARVQKLG
jgi:hypothetical protein